MILELIDGHLDADLAHNATNISTRCICWYSSSMHTTAGDSYAAPIYGGASNGHGTIYVDTDDGEIWIYA